MAGNRSMIRSLVAGAILGFADAVPLDTVRLRRPLEVVWRDERDLPDPLAGVPLTILDPVPVDRDPGDRRGAMGRALHLTLAGPLAVLHRFRDRLKAG